MKRSSIGIMLIGCTLAFFSGSCENAPTEPPPSAPATPVYDFFPPLAVGDTLSWTYTASVYGGTEASGVMVWTVLTRQSTSTSTVLQVSQLFTGTVLTGSAPNRVQQTVQGLPVMLTITEDSAHTVTILSGDLPGADWYIGPYHAFPRYQAVGMGDTLTVGTGFGGDFKAVKGIGPIQISNRWYGNTTRFDATYLRRMPPSHPDTVRVDPPRWGDFFPTMQMGDTASWDFSSEYTSVTGPGYAVTGTMRWEVTRTATGPTGTTTEIRQTLDAELTTWLFNVGWLADTKRITGIPSMATIREDTAHVLTIQIPIAWIEGVPGSLAGWTFVTRRFDYNNNGDDLVTTTTTASGTGAVRLVRSAGPGLFTYRDYGMSFNRATMTRRQEY